MNLSLRHNEDASITENFENAERAIIYRILKLERVRFQLIAKDRRRSQEDFKPLDKFKNCHQRPSKWLQKMLEEDVETEMKCHKAVLENKIPRFRILFRYHNMESINGRVHMGPRMNAEVTMAFLRYLYLHEMDAVVEDFEVASSLIYAGHYYDIPDLIDDVTLVIKYYQEQEKDLEWGSIDKYWDLYELVRLWEDGHPSKKTVIDSIFGRIKRLWIKSCANDIDDHTHEKFMEKDTAALTDFVAYLTKTRREVKQPSPIGIDFPEYGSRGNRYAVRGRACSRLT